MRVMRAIAVSALFLVACSGAPFTLAEEQALENPDSPVTTPDPDSGALPDAADAGPEADADADAKPDADEKPDSSPEASAPDADADAGPQYYCHVDYVPTPYTNPGAFVFPCTADGVTCVVCPASYTAEQCSNIQVPTKFFSIGAPSCVVLAPAVYALQGQGTAKYLGQIGDGGLPASWGGDAIPWGVGVTNTNPVADPVPSVMCADGSMTGMWGPTICQNGQPCGC